MREAETPVIPGHLRVVLSHHDLNYGLIVDARELTDIRFLKSGLAHTVVAYVYKAMIRFHGDRDAERKRIWEIQARLHDFVADHPEHDNDIMDIIYGRGQHD